MNNEVQTIVGSIKTLDRKMFVTSRFVADQFSRAHRTVTKAIQDLECDEDFRVQNFLQSDFVNAQGRTYQEYTMSRDGFMFLCMGFTGKEAALIKQRFIQAFNVMEDILLKQAEKQQDKLEWKAARSQIKLVRHSFTNTVKDFVEYAKSQGSQSAERYYANLTKMEYAALDMVTHGDKVPANFRDTLDLMDLGFLTAAEQVCRKAIQEGMNQNLHYKDIYAYAKIAVVKYADGLKLPAIGYSQNS